MYVCVASPCAQGALALLYVVHAFSCSWMFVSSWLQPSHVGAPSWIAADKQCAEWAYVSASSVYLRSVYFSITVLSTVGYGDIRPQTRTETGFMLVEVRFLRALFVIHGHNI